MTKHPYRAGSDLRTCLQGGHGSSGVGRQVIDRGRGPVAGRPARATLVIGEYRHACTNQMVTQQVKESSLCRSDGPEPPISTMPGDADAGPGTVMVALSRTST